MTPFYTFVIGALLGYVIVTGKLEDYIHNVSKAIDNIKGKYSDG